MSGLGKVQVPWPERLAMLTRSNFEMSSLGGLSRTGGGNRHQWLDRRTTVWPWVTGLKRTESLRLAVEAVGSGGNSSSVKQGEGRREKEL